MCCPASAVWMQVAESCAKQLMMELRNLLHVRLRLKDVVMSTKLDIFETSLDCHIPHAPQLTFLGEMPDAHLKQTINDWLLQVNTIDRDESADIYRFSSTNVTAERKRVLIETEFNQTECRRNNTRELLYDMSEDGSTSNTSQFSRSFMNRPVLVPTPPSSKRSTTGRRSPSPTRKLLALLSKADPPIRIYQPGNAVVQPQHVADLRKFLMKDTGVRVIPRVLEVRLKKHNCTSMQN